MEYDSMQLLEWISAFERKDLSLQAFGQRCEAAYHDFLSGGFVVMKKIEVYPFLKQLSLIHRERDERADFFPPNQSIIKTVAGILRGENKFSCSLSLRLPIEHPKLFSDDGFPNESILAFGRVNAAVAKDEEIRRFLDSSAFSWKEEPATVFAVLENRLCLLSAAMTEGDCVFKSNYGLFLNGDRDRKAVLNAASKTLDCYLGRAAICVLLSYNQHMCTVEIV